MTWTLARTFHKEQAQQFIMLISIFSYCQKGPSYKSQTIVSWQEAHGRIRGPWRGSSETIVVIKAKLCTMNGKILIQSNFQFFNLKITLILFHFAAGNFIRGTGTGFCVNSNNMDMLQYVYRTVVSLPQKYATITFNVKIQLLTETN